MDINERVLAAFQAEHKEHIEGIRALLSDGTRSPLRSGDPRLDEAFRLAHSLKGGARICDLRPAERLGHQLESLFSSVRRGELEWDTPVEEVVNHTLDFIEDWMAAVADGQQPPNADAALEEIADLLRAGGCPSSCQHERMPQSLADELQAAFDEEAEAYMDSLRTFLAKSNGAAPPSPDGLDEAFRVAHSLHSAADAAEIDDVATLAREIVGILSDLRRGSCQADEMHDSISALLEQIDAVVRGSSAGRSPESAPRLSAAGAQTPLVSGAQVEGDSSSERTGARSSAGGESVRIDSASLDRLIHCSGQLLSDLSAEDDLTAALNEFDQELQSMSRERNNLRAWTAAGRHHTRPSTFSEGVGRYLATVDRQLETLIRRSHQLRRLQHRCQWQLRSRGNQIHEAARQARMVTVESIFQGYRKLVRDLARDEAKQIEFTLCGLEHRADRVVLQALKDPLMHVLRNAVVHGIEAPSEREAQQKPATGSITMSVDVNGSTLGITVSDDGRGLNRDSVRRTAAKLGLLAEDAAELDEKRLAELLFLPGFTTARDVSELAGRGMGLSVLHATVMRLQGNVQIRTCAGRGTRIELTIPLSVATHRLVLVRAASQTYALPTRIVKRLLRVPSAEIETLEGTPFIKYRHEPLPLVRLAEVFEFDNVDPGATRKTLNVVVIQHEDRLFAIAVDALLAERDAIMHDLTGPAAQSPWFSGAILSGNGDVILVLNPAAIVGCPPRRARLPSAPESPDPADLRPPEVLVVDDSFTTRTLEKSILEAHGFHVQTAVDGAEALSLLQSHSVDLVICDVEMPRMDGFELLEKVKHDRRLKSLPFILVTSRDTLEDRQMGLRLGADAYIVKQKFDHQDLLDTIQRVL